MAHPLINKDRIPGIIIQVSSNLFVEPTQTQAISVAFRKLSLIASYLSKDDDSSDEWCEK